MKAERTLSVQQVSEEQPYSMPSFRTSPLGVGTPVLFPRRITRVQSPVPASFNSTTSIMVVGDNSVNR